MKKGCPKWTALAHYYSRQKLIDFVLSFRKTSKGKELQLVPCYLNIIKHNIYTINISFRNTY